LSKLNIYHNILVQAELKWAEIAIEHILMPRERLSGFPFVLLYYEILIRAIEIKKLLKKIIDWNAENNHRWSRMHTRRRTGRSRTTNDMAKYGALTAILSNLENEIYVKEVLADVKDFVYEILSITEDEIKEAQKLIKPYHNEYLVSSDTKRIIILIDFIKMLEQNEEKKKIDVKGWLNQVEKSNGLMTP
jgi:hypothetical protein